MPALPVKALVAILLFLVSAAARTDGFVFDVAEPDFRVSIPAFPQIRMEVHPMHAAHPQLRYLGSNGPYSVSVFTPKAAAGMDARECALATLHLLPSREGVPPLPQILRAQINPSTFLAMYATNVGGVVHLHAHYFSAAGGSHCVEVHATMASSRPEEVELWQAGMQKASIEPR